MANKALLVVIDQFRADCLATSLASDGFDNAAPLPNLQALMQESMTFTQHYTVTVPCGPSRASLLTGLYAMNHRSVRNGTPLASHHATLGHYLRTAGYEPLLFGYTDTSADPVGRHSNDPDLKDYEGLSPGFAEMLRMRLASAGPWIGNLKGKGYKVPANYWDIYKPELDPSTATAESPDGSPIRSPALYSAQDSDTAFLTDRIIETLSSRESSDWFSLLTYIRPHPPLVAPAPFNTMVEPGSLTRPFCTHSIDQLRQSHAFFKGYFSGPSNTDLFSGFDGHCDALTDQQVAELRAVYLGLAIEVDQHIGRVISYLRETNQYNDTLIVITSDHGEMLGDQHLWGKTAPFDPAIRIPLIIRDPRAPQSHGTTINAMTESVDITPTLMEWCGAEPQVSLDGRSLLPFIKTQTPASWRTHVFSEAELGEIVDPTRFQRTLDLPFTQANYAVLRTQQYKYVHFNGGVPPMLFDLIEDPHEQHNLAERAEYQSLLLELSALMLDHRMSHGERSRSSMTLTSKGLLTAHPA